MCCAVCPVPHRACNVKISENVTHNIRFNCRPYCGGIKLFELNELFEFNYISERANVVSKFKSPGGCQPTARISAEIEFRYSRPNSIFTSHYE